VSSIHPKNIKLLAQKTRKFAYDASHSIILLHYKRPHNALLQTVIVYFVPVFINTDISSMHEIDKQQ